MVDRRLPDGPVVQADPVNLKRYHDVVEGEHGFYCMNSRLVVPSQLRQHVLFLCHNALASGHFGITKTLKRVEKDFFRGWRGGMTRSRTCGTASEVC